LQKIECILLLLRKVFILFYSYCTIIT